MGRIPYPFDSEELLKKSKRIKRELLADGRDRVEKKIAVLGGSTTHDIVRILELFLLDQGIAPVFYESEYARYYEDAMFENPELSEFAPDVCYFHISFANLHPLPTMKMSPAEIESLLEETYTHFESCFDSVSKRYHCAVIANNFEYPPYRLLGNRDAYDVHGRVHYVNQLNEKFAAYANAHESFYLQDLNYLSASFGLDRWADDAFWHMYKYALSMKAIPTLSYSISNIIKSIYGKNKKALVLDLDNTLWGGVVGDDGVEGIEVGEETSMGQVYREFQSYLKEVSELGILLAVDSKNDEENALAGLNHPAGVLRPEDFVNIKANWNPKSENLLVMAEELKLLPESFVFVDDNPAEREIVRENGGGAVVPELGGPDEYRRILDHAGYFEMTTFSGDDAKRSEMYKENSLREQAKSKFADYGEYLVSLDMKASIGPFEEINYPRITQLTNKSNQFNLTTKRYNLEEITEAATDPDVITLCGRLEDKFGDNGIVSLVIGSVAMTLTEEEEGKAAEPTGEKALLIDLWLMSCRVLKRDMEYAMMDSLIAQCKQNGICEVYGYYYPTAKNAMVKNFYEDMGFTKISGEEGADTVWKYRIPETYEKKNRYIAVEE